MKRKSRIKLDFSRNWNLPGRQRIAAWLRSSADIKASLKNGIVWLNTDDIAIYTTADNYIEWAILTSGTYEAETGKIIRISLAPGDVALDIGGNIGLQSMRMAKCVGNSGHVYAFEPLSHLRQKFIRNKTLNKLGNITLLPFALADAEGEHYYLVDSNTWNQGAFSLHDQSISDGQEKITIKIGDELPEIKALTRLDLIKIDVEGYEYQVIKGLATTIQKFKPRLIFEYEPHYWTRTGQSLEEAYALLQNLGYQLYQITEVGCERIDHQDKIIRGNLFCIHEQ